MSDLPEGLGTAAEGVAMARVLEPLHGEKKADGGTPPGAPTDKGGHFAESACLNCGTPLTGHYCVECGQAAHLHRTFGAFLHDVAHGVLHVDGKTWRTLPMLALRPGRLTRDYIDGHRARYVSPMALFLFSVFLMFAAFQVLGISPPTDIRPDYQVEGPGEAMVKQLEGERGGLVAARDNSPAGSPARERIEERIAEIDDDLVQAREIPKGLLTGKGFSAAQPDSTSSAQLDHAIEKWRKNPGLMLYKLQSNSYKFSWLLIPLSLPFVALLFLWRRRFGIYDHAVFVTYSIAFMTLLFLTLAILGSIGMSAALVGMLMMLVPVVHLFVQVKGAYELSIFSALWRTAALLVFMVIVVVIFAVSLILLGTLG